jgi:hypothetical protein
MAHSGKPVFLLKDDQGNQLLVEGTHVDLTPLPERMQRWWATKLDNKLCTVSPVRVGDETVH